MARQNGWRILFRVEDLDGPRIDPQASQKATETLAWLGMDWDAEPVYQSQDLAPYHNALSDLLKQGAIYPCTCTRKEIQGAQSAPHEDDHELRYPGICRPAPEDRNSGPDHTGSDEVLLSDSASAWRLTVPDEPIGFDDTRLGPQAFNVQQQVGDFVVATKAGLPAYQLAVVVDDARQGVTQVVRGDDLLGSTSRQLLLYRLLGLGPVPAYTHLPLVVGPDGRRLAKRHGDTRVDTYRDRGVPAERIIALLARWSGIDARDAVSACEFAERFSQANMSPKPVTMTREDDAWLLDG